MNPVAEHDTTNLKNINKATMKIMFLKKFSFNGDFNIWLLLCNGVLEFVASIKGVSMHCIQ